MLHLMNIFSEIPLVLCSLPGPVLQLNLFCLQRKARAGPGRVWTNFSPSSNITMCWFCHICYHFNLSTFRSPKPWGFTQPIFSDSAGTPSQSHGSPRTGFMAWPALGAGAGRAMAPFPPSAAAGWEGAGRDTGHIPHSQLSWAAESARVDGDLLLTQSCNKSPPFWNNKEVAGVT